MKVIDTDNRGINETILTLEDGTKVRVNPVELFINMLENLEGKVKVNVEEWRDQSLQFLLDELDYTLES